MSTQSQIQSQIPVEEIELQVSEALYKVKEKLKEMGVEVLDWGIRVVAEGEVLKYSLELVVAIREVQSLYYDGLYDFCSETCANESENEVEDCIEECAEEEISEFDAEYGKTPFEFRYRDNIFEAQLVTYLDDNGYRRTWYDALQIIYHNQMFVSYARKLLEKNELEEKTLEYDLPIIKAKIEELTSVVKALMH